MLTESHDYGAHLESACAEVAGPAAAKGTARAVWPNRLTKTRVLPWDRPAAAPAILLFIILALGVQTARAASSTELEKRIEQLEQINRTLQQQVNKQAEAISALSQRLQAPAAAVQSMARETTEANHEVSAFQGKQQGLPVSVGFRAGWAESPYDMPGGVFYGAYLNHRLLTQEDGVPFGDLSGELLAGIVLGGSAKTTGNLASKIFPSIGAAESWMDTVEIEPTLQSHLDMKAIGLPSLEAFKPYALAGPGVWINALSTPVVNGSGPAERFRHYSADVQPGGVYGLGFTWQVGDSLSAPAIQGILNRTSLGGEWRYNAMANGEQFQQFTGSLSIGWGS